MTANDRCETVAVIHFTDLDGHLPLQGLDIVMSVSHGQGIESGEIDHVRHGAGPAANETRSETR